MTDTLEQRLRALTVTCNGRGLDPSQHHLTNPDGPEAAALIRDMREALQQVRADEMQVIEGYEHNGPQFTNPFTDSEYFTAGYVIEAAQERIAIIDAVLASQKIGLGESLHHVASFNLFIEHDGKLYATVSGGDDEAINRVGEILELEAIGTPSDRALKLLALAENLK